MPEKVLEKVPDQPNAPTTMGTAVFLPVDGEPKEVPFDLTPMTNDQGKLLGGAVGIVGGFDEIGAIVLRRRDTPCDTAMNINRLPAPMHRTRIKGPLLIVKNDEEGEIVSFKLDEYQQYLKANPAPENEGHDEDFDDEGQKGSMSDLAAFMAENGEALAAMMGAEGDEDEDDDFDEEEDDEEDDDEEDDESGEEDVDEEEAQAMVDEVLIKHTGITREQLKEKITKEFQQNHSRDPTPEEIDSLMNTIIMGVIDSLPKDDDEEDEDDENDSENDENEDEEAEEEEEEEQEESEPQEKGTKRQIDTEASSSSAPPAVKQKMEE